MVPFPPIGILGNCGTVECSFMCKQDRAFGNSPPGAYEPKAQIVAFPGAGMATVPMMALPCAGMFETDAPAVR